MREKLEGGAARAAAPVGPTTPQAAPPDGYTLITGTAGPDSYSGTGGSEQVYGLDGDDILSSAGGADWLDGGAGNDILTGGGGADIMTGGAGADRFVMKPGSSNDTVLDFEDGIDLIDASGFGAYLSVTQNGADAIVAFGGGVTLRLVGIQASTIADEDFSGLSFNPISGSPNINDNLVGTAGRDAIAGLSGNDVISGEGGNDIIEGGVGADQIHGGDAVDVISGNVSAAGFASRSLPQTSLYAIGDDDSIWGDAGNDILDGLFGTDLIWGGTGNDRITGGEGNDTLDGGDGDDVMSGDIGNDNLTGGLGADRLSGGAGNDTLRGGADGDVFVFDGGIGTETVLDFVVGQDLLDISAVGYYVSIVQSGAHTVIKLAGGGVITLRFVQASAITDASFVGLIGPQDDIVYNQIDLTENSEGATGTAGSDRMNGLGGDDTLVGGAGDDWLEGGLGNDTLKGDGGIDVMVGGAGNDRYYVDSGGDTVVEVGGGHDAVYTTLAEYVLPTGVEDLFHLSGGFAVLIGNAAANTIGGSDMGQILRGEAGNDILSGGHSGNGRVGWNVLDGGVGDDTLYAGADASVLFGGDGADRLDAQQYSVTMTGGAGADVFVVGSSYVNVNNTITDFVVGEDLIDLRKEGPYQSIVQNGADTLVNVKPGLVIRLLNVVASTVTSDSFIFQTYPLIYNGGPGNDIFWAGSGPINIYGNGGNDNLRGTVTDDIVDGGLGNDNLYGGDAGYDQLFGGGGHDRLAVDYDGEDADYLEGGSGNDTYIIWVTDIVVEAVGGGTDTVEVTGSGGYVLPANVENLIGGSYNHDVYTGNALNNTMTDEFGANTLLGLGGNDVLNGGNYGDTLEGGDGLDQLYGGAGNDILRGDAGVDKLYGEEEDDVLEGGAGNDILVGGAGGDTMSGGAANDVFRFTSAADFGVGTLDRILDWNVGDRIDLSGVDADINTDGDQAFVVVSAFTNVAGQLHRSYDSGLNETLIELDVNGDGAADYAFIVEGNVVPAWTL